MPESGHYSEGRRHGSRRMALAHVLAAGEYGGLESVVESLAKGLANRGHSITAILLLEEDSSAQTLERALLDEGIDVQILRSPARAYLREQQELRSALRQMRLDVVHGHGYRADIQVSFAAAALGLPSISTVHGFTGGGWKMRLYEALHERSLRRFSRVVAVSGPIAARLEAHGVERERIRIVQNVRCGSEDPLPRGAARQELGLAEDACLIGWVGRLSFEKGADLLLEAVALVERKDVIVCILGDGPELQPLRSKASRLGLADRVRWAGRKEKAGRFFRAFDAFVLSSRSEGTPIVLFEAAAADVPIVATSVGGVPDVFGPDEALLVEAGSPDLLARAIDQTLADEVQSGQRACRARDHVETRFAVAPWLDRYEEIYAELCRSR